MSLNHSSDRYKEQRLREGGKFVCDSCGGEFPMSHLRKQAIDISGAQTVYVGAMCCYEPDGGSLQRDLRRQYAARMAAKLSARELMPPAHDGVAYYGGVPDQADYNLPYAAPSVLTTFTPFPIVLRRGGPAVVVSMTGVGLTSSDTWTYPSGVTDSIPSVLNSSVSRTSTVIASALMTAGRYNLVYNGTPWIAAFDVR